MFDCKLCLCSVRIRMLLRVNLFCIEIIETQSKVINAEFLYLNMIICIVLWLSIRISSRHDLLVHILYFTCGKMAMTRRCLAMNTQLVLVLLSLFIGYSFSAIAVEKASSRLILSTYYDISPYFYDCIWLTHTPKFLYISFQINVRDWQI